MQRPIVCTCPLNHRDLIKSGIALSGELNVALSIINFQSIIHRVKAFAEHFRDVEEMHVAGK
jgi:hypothetical protein